jgi:hypothetical protein
MISKHIFDRKEIKRLLFAQFVCKDASYKACPTGIGSATFKSLLRPTSRDKVIMPTCPISCLEFSVGIPSEQSHSQFQNQLRNQLLQVLLDF